MLSKSHRILSETLRIFQLILGIAFLFVLSAFSTMPKYLTGNFVIDLVFAFIVHFSLMLMFYQVQFVFLTILFVFHSL